MVTTSTVSMDNLVGHLAIPDQGTGKGVLLVHAWWGLNEFFKSLADRLAGEGFVVFAPDYYGGKVARTVEEASEIEQNLERAPAKATLKSAVEYLSQHPAVINGKIGVIGVSLGTVFSLYLAQDMPEDIGAVVLYYGLMHGKYDSFNVPLQGHFAEHDEWDADPANVKEFRTELAASNAAHDLFIYKGTTHWFLEEDVKGAYDERAAALAFERTVEFLKTNL